MENLLLTYVMTSLLFLSLCVMRLSSVTATEKVTRNRDMKLCNKRLLEKEIMRCKLFAVWPALVVYEAWHLFKDR
jgi:hypothetical protein